MSLIVQKYGGSSLASPRLIRAAAQRIRSVKNAGNDVVVVVSAMGRMTDHLIKLAERTVSHPPQRELDMLLTAGERVSMALLSMALQHEGVPAISFTGSQSGIVTSSDHTEARIIEIRAHRIKEELKKGKVVIIAGFQGVSEQREITTLGRGGSDTSAVAIAAALAAESCDILTDVDGLFSADPRIVANAHLLSECSYDEALELAHLGAKMHSRSIELAKTYQVKVRIASSREEKGIGTRLGFTGGNVEKTLIRGIASKEGFHFFKARINLPDLVLALTKLRVPLHFFHQSDDHISFLCDSRKSSRIRDYFGEAEVSFEETPDVATVSAVGDGVSSSPEILPQFLDALRKVDSPWFLVCSNSLSITAAVPDKFREEVVESLHEKLVNEKPPITGASRLNEGGTISRVPPPY